MPILVYPQDTHNEKLAWDYTCFQPCSISAIYTVRRTIHPSWSCRTTGLLGLYRLIHFQIFHLSAFVFFHHYATSLFSSCPHKSSADSKCLPLCCQSYKSQRDTSKLPVNSIYIQSIYLMSIYKSYIENRQHDLSLTCFVFLLILLHSFSLYLQIIYCLTLSLARTLQTSVTCITTICHHRAVVYP